MANAKKGPIYSKIPAVAVEDSELGQGAFMMLCALGIHTDEEGYCHPGVKLLMEKLNITQQAVSKYINQLWELGYIELFEIPNPKGSGRKITEYRLIMDYALPDERHKRNQAPRKIARRPKEKQLTVVNRDEAKQPTIVNQHPRSTTRRAGFHNSASGVSQLPTVRTTCQIHCCNKEKAMA